MESAGSPYDFQPFTGSKLLRSTLDSLKEEEFPHAGGEICQAFGDPSARVPEGNNYFCETFKMKLKNGETYLSDHTVTLTRTEVQEGLCNAAAHSGLLPSVRAALPDRVNGLLDPAFSRLTQHH